MLRSVFTAGCSHDFFLRVMRHLCDGPHTDQSPLPPSYPEASFRSITIKNILITQLAIRNAGILCSSIIVCTLFNVEPRRTICTTMTLPLGPEPLRVSLPGGRDPTAPVFAAIPVAYRIISMSYHPRIAEYPRVSSCRRCIQNIFFPYCIFGQHKPIKYRLVLAHAEQVRL